MLRNRRKWWAAAALAALLALPGTAFGAAFDYGSFNGELGVRFGYGRSSKGHVTLYSLLPRWGIFLVRPGHTVVGGLGLSFVVEGILSVADADGTGAEVGFTPMLKLSLPLGRAAMFFVEGGAGIISESFSSREVAHAFNFTPQIGAGVDIALASRLGLTVAYRFRHSSNAGIYKENPAFNVHFVHAGLTYYY